MTQTKESAASSRKLASILLILVVFVSYGFVRYRNSTGDDLASSYVGSRLLIAGQSEHLFSHDSDSFAEVGEDEDSAWVPVAEQGSFHGNLHPYVQTPLWGYLLEPLCRRVDFRTFNQIFCLLSMLCFAGLIWLTVRYWCPSLFHPLPVALAAILLTLSEPFRYAMYLSQTHVLFIFLMIASLILEQKEHEWLAGFLLACAAAVKVTPGILVLYWLLRRRWTAAISAAVWSAVFWIAARAAVGPALWQAYVDTLHRISHVLLLALNNQSFAAVVMQHFYPGYDLHRTQILPLPSTVRVLSSIFMLAFAAVGGWIDHRRVRLTASRIAAPLGAMVTIIAATIFVPIAWTHYSIVLLVPLLILVDKNRALNSRLEWALIAAILLLNFRPFATDVITEEIGRFSIVRGQFYACVLTIIALIAMHWMLHPRSPKMPAIASANNDE